MTEPASSGAAIGFGIKSGFVAAAFAILVSALAVAIGFAVVPLRKGAETLDAGRRFAAGLLCSFTLGPLLTFKIIDWWPGYLTPWQKMLAGEHVVWVYLAAAAPILALTALPGFWLVAALMLWFKRRSGKDIGEMARDAAADVRSIGK